jgi:hypothetical protein
LLSAFVVYAEDKVVTFPIAELGGCQNKNECRVYCDNVTNAIACTSFAEAHNLISKDEAKKSKEFANAILKQTGPGKCDSPISCQNYCATESHRDECVKFAESHGLVEKKLLSRAKTIESSIQKGVTPGGCLSKKECEAYCDLDANLEECVSFSLQLDDEGQGLDVSGEGTLPFCTDKESCENFCDQKDHHQECLTFAQKRGLIDNSNLPTLENNPDIFNGSSTETSVDAVVESTTSPRILRMKMPEVVGQKNLRSCIESTLRESGVVDFKSFTATSSTPDNRKILESVTKSCLEKVAPRRIEKEKGPVYLSPSVQPSLQSPAPSEEDFKKCLLEKASLAGFDDKVSVAPQQRFVLIHRFLEECRAQVEQGKSSSQNFPIAVPKPVINPELQMDISLPPLNDPEDATIFQE